LPWAPRGFGPTHWRELAAAGARETIAGIPVEHPRYLHWPGRALRNARAFSEQALHTLLNGERPDVVIADYAWPAAQAAQGLRAEELPFVIHGRGSDVLEVAGEAGLAEPLSAALRRSGHWCAVSRQLVERMDVLGARPGHGVLVPNGVDRALFHAGDRAADRAALGLEQAGPLLLFVGHLIERKQPHLAVAVLRELRKEHERARLAIIGRGPLMDSLRVLPEVASGSVRLLGDVPHEQLARWYGAADLLLLTSSREGRPNVVLEALACGLPVLATPAGGTAELLEGFPACLCSDLDPRALARAAAQLLKHPPSREALAASVAHFTWDAACERLEFCLERAREQRR
jgi:teichuronic acid biosynthesis glycosyltransferase TuaC